MDSLTLARRRSAVMQAIAEHDDAFEWGTRDCVTFAARVVELIRGAPVVTPTWSSAEEAETELTSRGGIARAMLAALGKATKPSRLTPIDGDVVLVRAPGLAMAAVWANGSPIGMSSRGIVHLLAARAVLGWRT